MNLLLLFILSGLLLQGIKLLFNYLTDLYESPEETLISHSDESMYTNQLRTTPARSIKPVSQLALVQKTTPLQEKSGGKEVFMQTPFHQSA